MPLWSMDDWDYLERQVVRDPKGRQWSVALMDMLGQAGDSDVPSHLRDLLEAQHASGRYFTIVYSSSGAIQWERGHASLPDASAEFARLLAAVADGRLDPSQPVFRADLED